MEGGRGAGISVRGSDGEDIDVGKAGGQPVTSLNADRFGGLSRLVLED